MSCPKRSRVSAANIVDGRRRAARACAMSTENDENGAPTKTSAPTPRRKSSWPLTSSPPAGPSENDASRPSLRSVSLEWRRTLTPHGDSAFTTRATTARPSPKSPSNRTWNGPDAASGLSAAQVAAIAFWASRPCASVRLALVKSSSIRQCRAISGASRPAAARNASRTRRYAGANRAADANAALTSTNNRALRGVSATSSVQQPLPSWKTPSTRGAARSTALAGSGNRTRATRALPRVRPATTQIPAALSRATVLFRSYTASNGACSNAHFAANLQPRRVRIRLGSSTPAPSNFASKISWTKRRRWLLRPFSTTLIRRTPRTRSSQPAAATAAAERSAVRSSTPQTT
mmetsp:Transcript_21741/g.65233  ORF Transcript_21741/g.65233 Transcript_21741/m.65233 type:complete len:348 (+) Transcript_21741:332-1375(+)